VNIQEAEEIITLAKKLHVLAVAGNSQRALEVAQQALAFALIVAHRGDVVASCEAVKHVGGQASTLLMHAVEMELEHGPLPPPP
jgi:hypothetical protein